MNPTGLLGGIRVFFFLWFSLTFENVPAAGAAEQPLATPQALEQKRIDIEEQRLALEKERLEREKQKDTRDFKLGNKNANGRAYGRVELCIDRSDKEENKFIFDLLYAKKNPE